MKILLRSKTLYFVFILIFLHVAVIAVYAHQPHDALRIATLSPNFSSDNTLFVIRDEKSTLYKSVDGGKTYYPPTDPLTSKDLTTFAFSTDFSVDNTVFAGTETEGFFKSIGATSTSLTMRSLIPLFTWIHCSPPFKLRKIPPPKVETNIA